jgi:hypothetical protein
MVAFDSGIAQRIREVLGERSGLTGRPMKGYVYVEPSGLEEDRDLAAWVLWCSSYTATLPEKRPK